MTLPFQLSSYEGTAVILGCNRFIAFTESDHKDGVGTLSLGGLSIAESHRVLAMLTGAVSESAVSAQVDGKVLAEAVTPTTTQHVATQTAPKATRGKKSPEPAEAPKAAPQPTGEALTEAAPEGAGTATAEAPKEEPAKSPDPWGLVPAGQDPDGPKQHVGDLPQVDVPKLAEMGKLRDILMTLVHDEKVTSLSTLIALCESIKGQVPVLERIENLKDRLTRAVETLAASLPPLTA